MKLLHFADVHGEEKNYEEIKKCVGFMVVKAWEEKPGAIICSGDAINSKYLQADSKSMKYMASYFRELSNIAPIAVITGTDSHEGMISELLRSVSGKYPIHVSTTIEQIYLVSGVWMGAKNISFPDISNSVELVVSQVPSISKEHWKNRQGVEKDNFNIGEAMGSIFANFGVMAEKYNCPHVLSGHFTMKGSKITETQLLPGGDISIGADIIAMTNADLYCLGHIHLRQSYQIMGKEIAFHSGSMYRKNYGERDVDKGFYLHELKSASDAPFIPELSSKFIKVPTREMFQCEIDLITDSHLLDILPDSEDFSESIASSVKDHSEAGSFIKIKIKIYMDDIRLINQAKLKRLILEAGASEIILDIERVRRENSRDEEILKAVTLPDKVATLAEHQSKPMPDDTMEMLENVESMNEGDLVMYGLSRIG